MFQCDRSHKSNVQPVKMMTNDNWPQQKLWFTISVCGVLERYVYAFTLSPAFFYPVELFFQSYNCFQQCSEQFGLHKLRLSIYSRRFSFQKLVQMLPAMQLSQNPEQQRKAQKMKERQVLHLSSSLFTSVTHTCLCYLGYPDKHKKILVALNLWICRYTENRISEHLLLILNNTFI